jgi:hypothetical protein
MTRTAIQALAGTAAALCAHQALADDPEYRHSAVLGAVAELAA